MKLGFVVLITVAAGAQTPNQLAVTGSAIHQYDGGPAVAARSWFLAGEHVFVSFQVSGYKKGAEDQVKLRYTIDALDPAGRRLAPAHSGQVAVELAREDKNWTPKIRHGVQIPTTAPSGAFLFHVEIKDEIAGATTSADIPFQVRGDEVESAEELTIARVHFYKTEEDARPLLSPLYRPGDPVWVRFNVAGFRLADKNRYAVDYGVTVTAQDGKVFFQAPNAASFQDEGFYPARFVAGVFSLKLGADMTPGEYTVTLTVRDKNSNTSRESRHTFRVE